MNKTQTTNPLFSNEIIKNSKVDFRISDGLPEKVSTILARTYNILGIVPEKHFDMRSYIQGLETIDTDGDSYVPSNNVLESYEQMVNSKNECGSAACLAGWAALAYSDDYALPIETIHIEDDVAEDKIPGIDHNAVGYQIAMGKEHIQWYLVSPYWNNSLEQARLRIKLFLARWHSGNELDKTIEALHNMYTLSDYQEDFNQNIILKEDKDNDEIDIYLISSSYPHSCHYCEPMKGNDDE